MHHFTSLHPVRCSAVVSQMTAAIWLTILRIWMSLSLVPNFYMYYTFFFSSQNQEKKKQKIYWVLLDLHYSLNFFLFFFDIILWICVFLLRFSFSFSVRLQLKPFAAFSLWKRRIVQVSDLLWFVFVCWYASLSALLSVWLAEKLRGVSNCESAGLWGLQSSWTC